MSGVWGPPVRGAAQLAAISGDLIQLVEVGNEKVLCSTRQVVSFNFGMPQSMLCGSKQWHKHAAKMSDLVGKFANGAKADIIFGCEVGSHQQGLEKSTVDFDNVFMTMCQEPTGAAAAPASDALNTLLKGSGVVCSVNRP